MAIIMGVRVMNFGFFTSVCERADPCELAATGTIGPLFCNVGSAYLGSMVFNAAGWTVEQVGIHSIPLILGQVAAGTFSCLCPALCCGLPLLSQITYCQEQLTSTQRAQLYCLAVNGLCGSIPTALGAGFFCMTPLQVGYEAAATVTGYVLIGVGLFGLESMGTSLYLYCRASDIDPVIRAPLLHAPIYVTIDNHDANHIQPLNNRTGLPMTVADYVGSHEDEEEDNRVRYYKTLTQMV